MPWHISICSWIAINALPTHSGKPHDEPKTCWQSSQKTYAHHMDEEGRGREEGESEREKRLYHSWHVDAASPYVHPHSRFQWVARNIYFLKVRKRASDKKIKKRDKNKEKGRESVAFAIPLWEWKTDNARKNVERQAREVSVIQRTFVLMEIPEARGREREREFAHFRK